MAKTFQPFPELFERIRLISGYLLLHRHNALNELPPFGVFFVVDLWEIICALILMIRMPE
jgi:hypothetical protein